jgi:rhodanese-related sulfurtransferase
MKKLFINIITVSFLILSGCLKDAPITQATTEQNNSADILVYLETQGDYINSPLMPSLITAGDVFGNPDDKIILDIRSASDFAEGHIQNAINIKPSDLLNFVKTSDPNKTVVIVSLTGQSASYYTGLLRLDGNTNVFALKYGMASWNIDFAGSWTNDDQPTTYFTNKVFNKPPFSALPEFTFANIEGNLKEKINTRIQKLMNNTFSEDDISDASVSVYNLLDIYSPSRGDYLNTFIVSYAQNLSEYLAGNFISNPGHLPTAVYYQANNFGASDLRSTAFLQTIPNDKDIVVYSRIAHSSAFITAYLRLLGYRAKSFLFGMRWLVGFNLTEVRNYPYVTGP